MMALMMLCTLILCGCAAPKESSGPTTITIWHDKEDEVAKALTDALDKLAPEIIVRLEKKAGLTETLKLVGNDPKAAPDMYWFAHDKLGVYAEMGILSPITDFIDDALLKDYVPITLEAGLYQGKRYQLPLYFETLLFMYNKKYMSDQDVPATTEQLYEYMERKTRGGHFGFVEQHSTAYYSAGWIHAFGGGLIDKNNQPTLNTKEVIRALTYHLKFIALMPSETEYATVNTLFREGKAHTTIGGPWLIPTLREAGIDVGLADMPVVDETGLPLAPYSGVQGVHVMKVAGESKKEAVTEVLKALLNPEIGVSLALASGCAPANEAAYSDPRIADDDLVRMMRRTAQNAVPMPNIPEMDVMWTVVGNLLSDVNMSLKDVTQSADAAQKKALELVAAMK